MRLSLTVTFATLYDYYLDEKPYYVFIFSFLRLIKELLNFTQFYLYFCLRETIFELYDEAVFDPAIHYNNE